MLEIPIRVLKGSDDNSGSIQGKYDKKEEEFQCDPTLENCEIKE